MAFVPKFTLRSADNSTEIYRFPAVQNTNLPQTPRDTVTISNLRSKGAIVIDGGIKSFVANLDFVLWAESGEYEDIMALIDALENAIPVNTPFILRMDKTSSTYYEYKIKRIVPFEYLGVEQDLRLARQRVTARFLCNAW